ncbi:hypothetical protein [Caballeronia sp. AZ10_KS36]|uniref:hypothetical protein n=1 Tax=Caballeronia sp. AZ10_KS36 TaxID=2921757 RepID=UPI002028E066|nr:hypothetical protein [Caballeronia sp. AZ10_KS36]
MNLEDEERALCEANDDLHEADKRIQAQMNLLKEMERDGHDTSQGVSLLAAMREARKAMEGHRDRILQTIDLLKKGKIKPR